MAGCPRKPCLPPGTGTRPPGSHAPQTRGDWALAVSWEGACCLKPGPDAWKWGDSGRHRSAVGLPNQGPQGEARSLQHKPLSTVSPRVQKWSLHTDL